MGIGLLFLVIGLVIAVGGFLHYSRSSARYAAATTRWAQTHTTIESARVDVRQKMVNDTMTTDYVPVASYSYVVDGVTITGSRVALCGKDWRQQDADAWAAAYVPGTVHPVWFDPARPEDGALLLNAPSRVSAIILVLLGIGVTVFGILMIARHH